MKATAVANANIALSKYWGKRNSSLILPFNGSISMTCDGMHTKTTVEFSPKYHSDTVTINDEELKKDEKDIIGHIERVRKLAGIKEHARIVSESNFPVAAGLASSASGFAALTLAATKAAGLDMNERDLTILTR
ncbi:MAG: diphosphomevalonate decarboxylase, partial [Candidatus Aenigmarchaeota archaeon]|nr:diphosphomevalonate decarboxylase [Candidatus Aenigmarchaeota archaeon]